MNRPQTPTNTREAQADTTNPHLALLALLPAGREDALTGRDLAAKLVQQGHIPASHRDPARVVRQLVHELRAVGVPICADSNDGFYLPATPDELREYLGRLGHRVKELVEPFNALKNTYRDWAAAHAGQTSTEPEREPLSHIPEPYRTAYIHRITDSTSQPAAASHAAHHSPSPFTERGQGGEVPNSPLPRAGEAQVVKPNPPLPLGERQGVRVNIPHLIETLLPRLPVKPTTTAEEAANWLQMELSKILRTKPYLIYTPLAWLNREGWNRGAIALHIKDWLQRRKQQLAQSRQNNLFTQEEQP